jgi:hypothetical protein
MHRRKTARRERFRLDRHGQVLLLATVLLAVVLGLVGAFVTYLGGVRKATNVFSARAAARQAAQAGIEKALWCLNQSSGTNCGGTFGSDFAGETDVAVGSGGFYTTTVATLNSSLKTITSTGSYPTAANPTSRVTLKADATITTTSASFFYGVQTGNGGFELGNNANVQGNIYANGSVIGENGAYVTGTVWVAGGTALTPAEQQQTNNEDYEFARVSPVIDLGQSFRLSDDANINKVSFYLRKVGSPSNATVRILANNSGVPSKTVLASTTLNASAVTGSFAWVDASFTSPPALADGVTYWLSIDAGADSNDYFVIGSLNNNGYGNGIGMTSANWNAATPVWTDAGRDYAFQVYTGGTVTKIDNVDVQLDAHANTIEDLAVTQDAYYQTLTNSTVGGTQYPGSPDPGPQNMPISDGQIDQWKSEATAGGTITGDVVYDGTSGSLGPKKITGNLTVKNNASLTITGTLYVQGDVLFDNNAIISLSSGYGPNSGMVVADGKVTISNNVTFNGSGTTGSYVLVLTTNTSLDPLSPAMTLKNNSTNSIFYASDGAVSISNNATLKEVTGFKIILANNASVQYESGLANVSFSSGPGGSWTLKANSQREIR